MHEDSIQLLTKLAKLAPTKALEALHADLRTMSTEHFKQLIDELRKAGNKSSGTRARGGPKSSGGPAARIRRLMIDELDLDRDAAIRKLSAALEGFGFRPELPKSGRQNFEAWVTCLMKTIPPGEILAAAMSLASCDVHDTPVN